MVRLPHDLEEILTDTKQFSAFNEFIQLFIKHPKDSVSSLFPWLDFATWKRPVHVPSPSFEQDFSIVYDDGSRPVVKMIAINEEGDHAVECVLGINAMWLTTQKAES